MYIIEITHHESTGGYYVWLFNDNSSLIKGEHTYQQAVAEALAKSWQAEHKDSKIERRRYKKEW